MGQILNLYSILGTGTVTGWGIKNDGIEITNGMTIVIKKDAVS